METLAQLLDEGRGVLRLHNAAEPGTQRAFELARGLSGHGLFGFAAAIIDVARQRKPLDPGTFHLLTQRLALYTYKDTELPVSERLATALAILEELGLQSATDQETLGLAAAIHKRQWENTGKRSDLERCLEYYLRGYEQGIASDDGYTAINAAFVLDLVAREMNPAALCGEAGGLRDRAQAIRREIAAALTARFIPEQIGCDKDRWWAVSTVIEAFIGLADVEHARPWLKVAQSIKADSWERESTLRQLQRLIHSGVMDSDRQTACHAVLKEFFPVEYEAIRSRPKDRVGLALSGGGFRASLFHLGVLARLAELNVLRDIEVFSCVSGGSITGTYYYLAVRSLLQSKADKDITQCDYIDIVRDMIAVFLRGTQANIRMLSLAGFMANLRMVFDPKYARSDRIAQLYDEHFFRHVPGNESQDSLLLSEVGIRPKGCEDEVFVANRGNWGRVNKVPKLLLNATALNTGHNWQFSPASMGENGIRGTRIDARFHLRRIHFDQVPEALRHQHVSRAVAASSCVPALFPPVSLLSIYPGKFVALVDGAIHDNQGMAGLLSEDCRVLLVSDAAGHISALDRPSLGYPGVMARSIGILQTRLREAQHRETVAMQNAGVVQLLYLHLKHGTVGKLIDWQGCDIRPLGYAPPESITDTAAQYGISTEILGLLASMRTDLDAFSELEANALMYSGYQIAGQYASAMTWAKAEPSGSQEKWSFMNVAGMMSGEDVEGSARLIKHLRASGKRGGKWLQLSTSARLLGMFLTLLIVAAAGLTLWKANLVFLKQWVGWTLIGAAGVFGALLMIAYGVQYWRRARIAPGNRPALTQIVFDLLMLLFGWIPAKIDLAIVRPAFLKLGRVAGGKNSATGNVMKKV